MINLDAEFEQLEEELKQLDKKFETDLQQLEQFFEIADFTELEEELKQL